MYIMKNISTRATDLYINKVMKNQTTYDNIVREKFAIIAFITSKITERWSMH